MTKQEKINELTKQIEELTKELNDVVNEPERKKFACYGDNLYLGDDFCYINENGKEKCVEYHYLGTEIAKQFFHNCYDPLKGDLTQQINYQKIINRMWQLAYELNHDGWVKEDSLEYNTTIFNLYYNDHKQLWVVNQESYLAEPLPLFYTREACQQAADDLNDRGYKL